MSEVKQHQSEGSMWTVLKGRVYNLSPYMKFHPGGIAKIFELEFFPFCFFISYLDFSPLIVARLCAYFSSTL